MRKKNELLTKGEESLMELFWDASDCKKYNKG